MVSSIGFDKKLYAIENSLKWDVKNFGFADYGYRVTMTDTDNDKLDISDYFKDVGSSMSKGVIIKVKAYTSNGFSITKYAEFAKQGYFELCDVNGNVFRHLLNNAFEGEETLFSIPSTDLDADNYTCFKIVFHSLTWY